MPLWQTLDMLVRSVDGGLSALVSVRFLCRIADQK